MANSEANARQFQRPTCSIAFALRLIARSAGIQISADDVCSAMGLPWFFCAAKDDESSCDCPFLARDMFLVPLARALGMTVREIHPPTAAQNLHGKYEFIQHFEASYAPIVRRALENKQPILAWRGWSGGDERCWGLVTDTCDGGVGLRGSLLLKASGEGAIKDSMLEHPPVQVYVIEQVDPITPSANELAELALCHARALMNDERGAEFGVITGPNAFRSVLAGLEGASRSPEVGLVDARLCADQLAMFVGDQEIGLRSIRVWLDQSHGRTVDALGELLEASEKLRSVLDTVACIDGAADPQATGQSESALRTAVKQAIALSESMRDALQSPPPA